MCDQLLKKELDRIRFADDQSETVWERAEVEEQIAQAIRRVSFGKIRELMVEANGDTVVLKGRTAWYRWKKAAQDVAMDLLGNVRLLNGIEVH